MSLIRLEFLGGFAARLEDGQACVLPTRKAQALLAYLALPPGRFHSREKLTALLWGETAEEQARQSFRQTLSRLRRALGETALITRGDTVALNPAAVAVDVADFETALAEADVRALDHAVALYKGDLLDGFTVDEAPFEEWRIVERERLHERALEGLARLLREHVRAERTDAAIHAALKLLALDPLQESAHRTLMHLLWRQGRRAAALQQYQSCVGWLQRELGTEPEEETRALYRELLRSTHPARDVRPEESGVVATPTDRQRQAHSPMVGRAAEIEALRHTLDRALDVGGRVAVVSGEGGIGKSRLIQELSAHATTRGIRILSAWCHETEQPLPFRPWLDALRGMGAGVGRGVGDRLSKASRAALGHLLPELGGPAEQPAVTLEHMLLFEALSELVQELSQEAPLVIVLEDLHWGDAMSVRLLAFLGRRLGSLPVFIVGSVRSEEVDFPVLARALDELRSAGQLDEVSLGALTRDESLALARALHSRGRRRGAIEEIADDLWALSEGNPFVIVETMRTFNERSGPGGDRPSIPQSVRQSVTARLDRLSEPARRTVAAATVVGRACSFKLLSHSTALGEMEGAAAVEELVRRRVLETVGDRLVISHDRIRQVAYDDLVPARRVALHGAVARALETLHQGDLDEVANELGHHFLRAGEIENALVYLERFADVAARRYALDAAIDALRQAADAVEQLPEPTRDRRRLEVMLRQTFVMSLAGRHRESLQLLRQHAVLHKHIEDPALASDYHFRVATACHHFGQYVEGKIAAEAAIREGERAGDNPRVGKGLYALSIMSIATGALSDAVRQASRAATLLDAPRTRHWLGLAHWSLTWAHTVRGELDIALESSERCADIARAPDDRRLQAFASYTKSLIYAAYGDARAAADCARGAKDAAVADPVARSLTLLALAYAHLEAGEARQAIEVFHQILERGPASITQSRVLALLGDAHLAAGELDAGTEAAREALRRAAADGSPFVVGLAERALGRLARASGEHTRGAQHLSRALESFGSSDAQFEAAMTRLDLARDAGERGEDARARAHIVEAVRVFSKVGAHRRVAQAHEVARDLGIDVADL